MADLNKILYAEDDIDIRTITMMVFEGTKYTIEPCCSGQEVIDKTPLFKPQLILLDVMMPNIDGVTAFKMLKKSDTSKNIPVIFITAKVNKKEVERYYALGAIGVIYKPFNPNTLQDEIETMYNKYEESNKCQ